MCTIPVLAIVGLASRTSAQGTEAATLLARAAQYVHNYYNQAQSVVAEERVTLQPLARDLTAVAFARRLTYELRIEWDPSAAGDEKATVVRTLLRASGPPLGPPSQPDCVDPRPATPEPLVFLLAENRDKFRFVSAGSAAIDGHTAMTLDFRPITVVSPTVKWTDACGDVDLRGRIRGRVWIEPNTGTVLRLDERLVSPVDIPGPDTRWRRPGPLYFRFERADTTTRYARVSFTNPEQTLWLPSRVEGVFVVPQSGLPRLRITQEFSNYRRFVTESRLIR